MSATVPVFSFLLSVPGLGPCASLECGRGQPAWGAPWRTHA